MGPACASQPRHVRSRFARAERGATAVEFALVGPILVMLLLGILVYGGYFLMAHSVQQLANDSARAALAGLTDDERRQLAAGALSAELPTYGYLDPQRAQLSYSDQAQVMTVDISYDASASPLWALSGIVPMPSSAIERKASVQVGGY